MSEWCYSTCNPPAASRLAQQQLPNWYSSSCCALQLLDMLQLVRCLAACPFPSPIEHCKMTGPLHKLLFGDLRLRFQQLWCVFGQLDCSLIGYSASAPCCRKVEARSCQSIMCSSAHCSSQVQSWGTHPEMLFSELWFQGKSST